MKIKKLSSDLINKIAAGEVVERPASVVKELVENSIDAGADLITIKIEKGGKRKIIVKDNGSGIPADQVKLALQRHTTSKIESVDDLNQINSFGFRGEALASIASVAKVKLQTKTKKANYGTEINNANKISKCAHTTGTTIEIRDLFYNIPARQKFLKTDQTEFNHIQNWIKAQALAYPKISFILKHNNREILRLSKNQKLKQRIAQIFEQDLSNFIKLKTKTNYFKINGLIAPPQKSRQRKTDQYLFVNKRHVFNKTVFGAVSKAYREMLHDQMHPPFVLFLTIRPDLIDVNVHPRKQEIKFISGSDVFNTVYKTIRTNLSKQVEKDWQPESSSYETTFKPQYSPLESQNQGFSQKTKQVFFQDFQKEFHSYAPNFDNILQIAKLYLVVPKTNGIVLIDQHAAEERILLEKFIKQYQKELNKNISQALLFDLKIKLNQEEIKILKQNFKTLKKLGFRVEPDKTTKITAVPAILKDKNIKQIILGFIDDLKDDKQKFEPNTKLITPQIYHTLATLACRAAIKQGDVLSSGKKQEIVSKLKGLGTKGTTCPHGRPTWIKFSLHQLHRMFKRE